MWLNDDDSCTGCRPVNSSSSFAWNWRTTSTTDLLWEEADRCCGLLKEAGDPCWWFRRQTHKLGGMRQRLKILLLLPSSGWTFAQRCTDCIIENDITAEWGHSCNRLENWNILRFPHHLAWLMFPQWARREEEAQWLINKTNPLTQNTNYCSLTVV